MQESEENEHLRNADFSKLLFSYTPLSGTVARKSVERALWKLYSYARNDENGPKGMGVEGTISIEEHFPEAYTINFDGTHKPMTGVNRKWQERKLTRSSLGGLHSRLCRVGCETAIRQQSEG